jgi:hypothetical protein
MLSSDQPGEYLQTPGLDYEIVVAPPKLDAAHFLDAHATTLCTIIECHLL